MTEKILFWLDGALTNYCMAFYLQKKIDSDFFAIVDSYDKPKTFFKNQKLIDFKKTWFYHDFFQNIDKKPDLKYLSDFEKKYEINLWELAINERIFYRFNRVYKFSHDEILSILEHECKLFDEILTTINPDFLVMHEPTLHQHELLYRMCQKTTKTLLLNQPNISRSIISRKPRHLDLDIKLDQISASNRNFKELRDFRKSFSNYESIQNFRYKFKISKSEIG